MVARKTLQGGITALVIFVDVRGFTAWAQNVDVFPFIDEFGTKVQALFKENFKGHKVKNMGDGAMIIRELTEATTRATLKTLLAETLASIQRTEDLFRELCRSLEVTHGTTIDLPLGWGITKGTVKPVLKDFIGSDINKCSRLCAIARPFGIVIDAEDFPEAPDLPASHDMPLYKQLRPLVGIDKPISVWVTREIESQFIVREQLRQVPEVHIAGVCIKVVGKRLQVMVAKRVASRRLFPNLYAGCGGQLAGNEKFEEGVARHYRLEMGVNVEVIQDIHSFYTIEERGEQLIPGIHFLCLYKSGEPKLRNYSEIKWVSLEDLKKEPDADFVPGYRKSSLKMIGQYQDRTASKVSPPNKKGAAAKARKN